MSLSIYRLWCLIGILLKGSEFATFAIQTLTVVSARTYRSTVMNLLSLCCQIKLLIQLVLKLLYKDIGYWRSEFATTQTLAWVWSNCQKTCKVTLHPRILVVSAKTWGSTVIGVMIKSDLWYSLCLSLNYSTRIFNTEAEHLSMGMSTRHFVRKKWVCDNSNSGWSFLWGTQHI